MTDPNHGDLPPYSDQPGEGYQPPSFDKPPSFDQPGEGYQPPQPPPYQPPQQPPYQPQGYPQQNYPPPPQNYPPPPPGIPQAPPAQYYQQPGPGGTMLDPKSGLYLPPGVELASHGRRIGAFFLRFVLIVVTLVIGYLVWGLILWNRGTSPALKVLGMKCWLVNESKVAGFWRMALRNIVGEIVEGIFILPIVGFIMFLVTGKRQSLHDVIGGTTVVYDPNKVLGG